MLYWYCIAELICSVQFDNPHLARISSDPIYPFPRIIISFLFFSFVHQLSAFSSLHHRHVMSDNYFFAVRISSTMQFRGTFYDLVLYGFIIKLYEHWSTLQTSLVSASSLYLPDWPWYRVFHWTASSSNFLLASSNPFYLQQWFRLCCIWWRF